MSTQNLRDQILKELTESVEKKRKTIEKLDNKAQDEMFVKSTIPDSVVATVARNACDSRANYARQQANDVRRQNAWGEEMLEKYGK